MDTIFYKRLIKEDTKWMPTVLTNVDDMVRQGIFAEVGKPESTGGSSVTDSCLNKWQIDSIII